MNQNNETANKGTNTANSTVQTKRSAGQANSGETGVQSSNSGVLEATSKGGGTQSNQHSTEETQGNRTMTGDPNWLFAEPWNSALDEDIGRPTEPRDYLWASELGKAPIDVFLRMKGTPPTNPPNARSRRKFEAGNMFEWIVGLVLKRAGILQSGQERVEFQYPNMCRVSGKSDYVAGGTPDYDKARAELEALELPPMFYRGFENVIEHLKEKYPNGLGIKPLEIKSLSAMMFDAVQRRGRALRNHRMQLTHYERGRGDEYGNIVYICRDDLRMMEIPVLLKDAEAEYKAEVEKLSGYYKRDEMPPLEKPIIWDEDLTKFCKNNMGVAYSMYLTKLYGFKDQEEFDSKYTVVQNRFNSVCKRIATGAKMTKLNEETIVVMAEMGFDAHEYAKLIPLDTPEEEPAAE